MGAHLVNAAACGVCQVFYWRDRNREVDFVVQAGKRIVAIEVKGGHAGPPLLEPLSPCSGGQLAGGSLLRERGSAVPLRRGSEGVVF